MGWLFKSNGLSEYEHDNWACMHAFISESMKRKNNGIRELANE